MNGEESNIQGRPTPELYSETLGLAPTQIVIADPDGNFLIDPDSNFIVAP